MAATDPKIVLDFIERNPGAMLDEIRLGCGLSRSTTSRLIKKLALRDFIFRLGKSWYFTSVSKTSGQSGQDYVLIHGSQKPAAAASLPAEDGLGMGCTSGRPAEIDEPAAPPLALRAAGRGANGGGANSMPMVMSHILHHVAGLRSKHNQVEGMKKSRDENHPMKLNDREITEDMRNLSLDLQMYQWRGWSTEDFSSLARQMNELIPD